MVEVDQMPDPLRDELLSEPVDVKNGYVDIPDKPGLGVELSKDGLRKYSLK
jgi:D-galactarolactone cycloisomerase